MVLTFPINRALALPDILNLSDNRNMSPMEMFKAALKTGDIPQAIRLVASVTALQTKPNFLLCCKDPKDAFDLLRFVPASRKIKTVVEIAANETRVARLVAEDLPDLVNDSILRTAINGEKAWADRYKAKYKLTNSRLRELMNKPKENPGASNVGHTSDVTT